MSRPPIHTDRPGEEDALLQRYQEANALDTARPSPALREAVLIQARSQATAPTPPPPNQRPAANDSHWKLRALGSLAMLGLVGLLVMQFERGTPDEQAVALGVPAPRIDSAALKPQAPPPPEAPNSATGEPPVMAAEISPPASPQPAAPARSAPPRQAPNRPAALAKAAPPATAPAPETAEDIAPMASAPTAEAMAVPDSLTRAAPPPRVDAAPTMAPAEAPPTMGTAPSAAPMAAARSASSAMRERSASHQAPLGDTATGNAADAAAPNDPPLHAAVASGNLDQVRKLLAQGADIDARDSLGRTPLMRAAMGRSQPMVSELLAAGANANLRDHAGKSAADHAARAGHTDWLPLFPQPAR